MVKVGEQGIFLSDNTAKKLSPYMLNAYKKTLVLDLNALQSFTELDPVFSTWLATPPNVSIFTNDAGYLTSFSETDPVYTASSWYSTTNNATNWNTSFGWGNHASAGYLTSITSGQITTALGFTPVTNARTLTINGTTYDLSADRSWTVSGGISTLNTLTGVTQTFATGTTGTDFSISSSGTTHTFNIPTASSSNRGVLSTTDWTTFNSKESALTFSTGLTRTSNTITSNISTGVSGGQTIIGGTASGNSLTLSSTSNATKGKLLFGTSAYDEVNNRLGIGTNAPSAKLEVRGISDFWGLQVGNGTVGALFQVYGGKAGFVGFNGSAYNSLDIRSGISTQLFLATNGNVGIGQTSPTAVLHIKAGTASAGTAPIKFTSGTNLTTPEAGAVEYDGTELYFTPSTTRYKLGQVTAGSSTIASGTYTPTLTGVTNVTSTTAYVCQYMRVGNVVTVSGKIEVTPTVNNAQTTIGVSLPIASNFANSQECGGAAHSVANTVLGHGAAIYADATNDRAEMDYFETHGASDTFSFSFTYQII